MSVLKQRNLYRRKQRTGFELCLKNGIGMHLLTIAKKRIIVYIIDWRILWAA